MTLTELLLQRTIAFLCCLPSTVECVLHLRYSRNFCHFMLDTFTAWQDLLLWEPQ